MGLLAIVPMRMAERAIVHGSVVPAPPHLDVVALFGFLSALVTLGCLPHLRASRGVKQIFTASLAANAFYAFLSGAWPLGLVAIAVTGMAGHSWWKDAHGVQGVAIDVSRPVRINRRDTVRVFGKGYAPENN